MRERTPSADDTPKRAPPAPPGEADVAVRKATEVGSASVVLGASRMVASTHSPDDLGVSPIASASQHLHHHHHHPHYHNHHPPHPHHPHFPSHGKSAQDKRSRLSNVINNLLKKVPATPEATTTSSNSSGKPVEESDNVASSSSSSGSERNLETLEKYVMTVLSSVAEEKKSSGEEQQQPSKLTPREDEGEAKLDHAAALPPCADDLVHVVKVDAQPTTTKEDSSTSPKSLSDIILERLNDQQQQEQLLPPKQETTDENDESSLRTVCEELLNDLLTTVQKEAESTQSLHCSLPLDKVASVLQSPPPTSTTPAVSPEVTKLAVSMTTTTPVRHLCLYCDRKFASISLRQRHTERVHQASLGGRRSERNGTAATRKSSQQSCQYCVDRYSENLEGLFQHLVASHSDKYHGCLQCSTRYLTQDALASHNREIHPQPVFVKEEQPLPAPPPPPPPPQPEFDSNFYSNVSCNIRDNLLHHLDGKLQADAPETSKTPQYQQLQPIDISLTAVTPVYAPSSSSSLEVVATLAEETENTSEPADKPPVKTINRAHPRRVSFEKYNFPRKYDGKEQWSCAIKDLSRFDISTQLTLRKKQRSLKDNGQLQIDGLTTLLKREEDDNSKSEEVKVASVVELEQVSSSECASVEKKMPTVFTNEFESFLRLKTLGNDANNADKKDSEIVYAELTGEWARPRIYICGACADRYTTMKELEDHKSAAHPNVWCMHFEFSGDQRELYKHLVFLPGVRCSSPTPSMKTRSQQPSERVCTKCNKSCASLAELHRHMLECGGDQAWLLGLFGNGKKKCKWRPFGSRSRRRRQRGMKRNIQNSQTPRNNTPRERPSYSGPRVRPSDRESIQKMLANLPAKRATRKVLQENAARSQGRLRNLQSRARAVDNPASRIVKSKAVLRNKLLKNAKSFQRKKNLREEKQHEVESEQDSVVPEPQEQVTRRAKHMRSVRVLSKKKNVTVKESAAKHVEQPKRRIKRRSAIVVDNAPLDDEEDDEEELPKKKTNSSEYVASGRKLKRRILNPLTSINASLKAKSQLRTNDGKFARNVGKKLIVEPVVTLDVKSLRISKRSVNDPSRLLTRSKLRAAATSAWKEHAKLTRRITRLRSIDADEVETDSTDKEDAVEATSEAVTVVTKQKIGRTSSRRSLDGDIAVADKSTTESTLVPIIGRGRRPKKDVTEAKVNNESSTNKLSQSPTEPKTRSQRLSSNGDLPPKPRRTVTFKDERDALAETPKKNSKSALEVSSSPDADVVEGKIVKRRNSKAKESPIKKALKESSEKKNLKRAQKDAESKKAEEKTAGLENNDSSPLKKEKVLRKSQRNKDVNTKDTTGEAYSKVETKSKETVTNEDANIKELAIESPNEPEKSDANVENKQPIIEPSPKKTVPGKRRGRVKRSVSIAEEIKPSDEVSTLVEKADKIETEITAEVSKESTDSEAANLTAPEISSENNDSSIVSSEERNDSSNAQNLSLEALQQESSNSNMDSGKENSSEAIANLCKLKVVRPKKSRGRKDKTVATKRSLNSVIGILTEGVNVPLEAQDSTIVLTAQTTIEPVVSSNTQITFQSSDQTAVESSISSTTESKVTDVCENISDKVADVADVSANAAVPISAVLPQTSQEPAAVVFEEIRPKIQDEPKAAEESQKGTMPVLEKINIEVAKEVAPFVEPPTNDIILDLSRRKPKGKGSFLEKIVSKIAKQKDVSLDGDNSCHLDIAHISSNSQKIFENTSKQTHIQEIYSTKIDEIKPESVLNRETSVNVNEAMVNIVNNKTNHAGALVDETIEKSVDTSLSKLDSVSNSIIENSEAVSVKTAEVSISNDINESESKLVDNESDVMNGVIEKIDSKVSIDLDSELPVTTDKESTDTVKQKPKQKQKSKKRSLDSNSPTKNKKKSVDDDKTEDMEEEEEICLADIMKLLDRSKPSGLAIDPAEKIEVEAVKPGKRKTPDDETVLESSNTDVDTTINTSLNNDNETSRKSRRKSAQKKNKNNEHPNIVDEICNGSQVDHQIEKSASDKIDTNELPVKNGNIPTIEQLENTQEIKLSEECNTNSLINNQALLPEQNLESELRNEKSENEIIDRNEPSKSRRKATLKNIDSVTEPETNEEIPSKTDESFKVPESTEITKPGRKRSSRRRSKIEVSGSDQESEKDVEDIVEKSTPDENDSVDQNSSMSESEEKSINIQVSKRTTRNSKHIAFEEPFDNTANIKDSDDSDVLSLNDIDPSRRRRSQRKNITIDSSRDVSVSSTDENVASWEIKAEKKTTRSRRAKKNVTIIDEPVEFNSEISTNIDSPLEPENMTIDKLNSEQIKETRVEVEEVKFVEESLPKEIPIEIDGKTEEASVSEIKDTESQEKSEEILNVQENLETPKESPEISSSPESQQTSIDEMLETTNKQESTLPSELSSCEHDDSSNFEMQAPKKRVAGNFAIVTKSGKILIVEKKKKLTKEAAKFFCEVCSTSFTRKSSLKKHNSSQSHILQVTMHGDKIKEADKEIKDSVQVPLPEDLSKLVDETIDRDNEKENEILEEKENDIVEDKENEIVKEKECEIEKEKECVIEKVKEIEPIIEKAITPVENKEIADKIELKEPEPMIEEKPTDQPKIDSNVVKFIEPAIIIPEPRFTHKSPEEELEDEMLDEEICKITENMSHEEYVLTDHVSPLTPEASSTPVNEVAPLAKNAKTSLEIPTLIIKAPLKNKNKKDKKKINLADEHLSLDTPVPIKIPETVDSSKENNLEACVIPSIPSDSQFVGKIDEPVEPTIQIEEITSSKSESKSKKNAEKKTIDENKRSSRNRNQHSKQEEEINLLESSRPKRNQLRPSYKEEDFDLILFPNESTEERQQETLKSKRDKSNISAVESEQSDFERDVLHTKAKEISANPNKNTLNAAEIADTEIDISNKKQKGKKNQAKKEDKEGVNTKDLEISLIEKDKLVTELNDNEDINLMKSKVESNEVKDIVIELTEDIIAEEVESAKKKRGRKPKNAKVDSEKSVLEGDVSTDSSKLLIEQSITDKQVDASIVPEKLVNANQKQSKSRKNQNKRNLKNASENEKDLSNVELTEKSTFADDTEISIQSLPVDQSVEEKIADNSTKQSPFSKSTENLKTFEEAKNDVAPALLSDFDSDENSLDTNISVDIQKLLDDPEMTTEIAKETDEDSQSTINNVDVMNVKKPITPTVASDAKEELNKAEKTSAKSAADRKAKKRGRKPKNNAAKINDASSLSDASEVEEEKTEDQPQRSKNKIVKSVFGRVFGGEKVKEVLDDWQSRSESSEDSVDEEVEKTTRRSRSAKHQRNVIKSAESVSRSRQSKKRAEELISRSFNDDSPVAAESRAAKNQRLSRKNQAKSASPFKDKTEGEENEGSGEDSEEENEKVSPKSKRGKKRSNVKDLETSVLESKQAIYQSNDEEDEQEIIDNTEDSQVSQSTLDKVQYSEVDNTETEELNGRLSPTYSSNDDDDTLRSSSDEEDSQKPKKKRTNELLTIAPTDAVEDNAQDLELPANKPKVLNFDEELFVECCSRLKATSEKEFRNAKKIKLDQSVDHQTGYSHHHRRDEQLGYRKDRWRDVESQNSLGSLLESVNQLLGEEYSSQEKDYSINASKRRHHGHHHHGHHHHHHHHHNRRHDSPERSLLQRAADDDNMGYDDSLDVAFEHNNKLRDKIQQRMRESEDLIATSFGQKNSSDIEARYNSYTFDTAVNERHSKSKPSNGIDGLLDKTLSNLLQNNEKHDHPSTPMNLLAELACARAPSVTTPTMPEKPKRSSPSHKEISASIEDNNQFESRVVAKKLKNPIKELFERKNELNEKKQQMTKLKISSPKSSDKPKKQKKVKNTQHNLPIIRTSQYRGGLAERKKRRDSSFFGKKKNQSALDKVKDIYDFDDEESASDPGIAPVLSYRTKADTPKEINMSALLSKTIGDTLANGKSVCAIGENLENMLDRKFKDVQNIETATKSPIRTADQDDKPLQQNVIGPMDEFVERRQKSKRSSGEHSTGKHSGKSKKKAGKSSKKKSRNAWYENDSSDEFVTKLKADDIGVGISKSQRTCSKGKQNLFAEISSTSSESELEDDDVHFRKKRPTCAKKLIVEKETSEPVETEEKEEENWPIRNSSVKRNSPLIDHDNKKSESELSDHPLVIDENLKESGDTEHQTNSDDEPEERTFELDDLYREDSSIVDSDRDESSIATEEKSNSLVKATDAPSKDKKPSTEKYISIEDALELLDRPEEETLSTPPKKERSSTASKQSTPEVFQKAEKPQTDESQEDEEENLPEKLSSNEKPQRQSENLPLHVFLSRKVQESKKRKQQQELKKLMEEQERIMLDLQPARRQRKCAIGKQGLLAEISSSDEELSVPYRKKSADRADNHHEKPRSKQKQRESKEKRKERYLEKKHEQMIAKEQKAIEEEIMRELEEKRLSAASEASSEEKDDKKQTSADELSSTKVKMSIVKNNKANARKQRNHAASDDNDSKRSNSTSRIVTTDTENDDAIIPAETSFTKKKRPAAKSPQKNKKLQKTSEAKPPSEPKKAKQTSSSAQKRAKSRPMSANRSKEAKESRSQSGKRESDLDDDEELKATKSWNKLDEGVGVAIGRRKRAAANQLYYWSSSSDDDEMVSASPPAPIVPPTPPIVPLEGPEDDKLQQHGWIVGDSHKKMITMLAMEKQLKEKRRRSENDEQPPGTNGNSVGGKGKSKKHRNST